MQNSKNKLSQALEDVFTNNRGFTIAELKDIAEVAKVIQTQIPWYEQCVSTIGVVAFFSMLIATGVQTMKSTVEQVDVARLQQEVKTFDLQKKNLYDLISKASEYLISQYQMSGKLESSEISILVLRQSQLESNASLEKYQVVELFNIALVMSDLDRASKIVEKYPEVFSIADPATLLSLSEYYYLIASLGQAKETLKRLDPQVSNLSIKAQAKVLILNAALSTSPERYKKEYASLLKISIEEADMKVDRAILQLKNIAKLKPFLEK